MNSLFGYQALVDTILSDLYRKSVALGYVITFLICFSDEQVKGIRTHINDRNLVIHSLKAREDTNFRNPVKKGSATVKGTNSVIKPYFRLYLSIKILTHGQ